MSIKGICVSNSSGILGLVFNGRTNSDKCVAQFTQFPQLKQRWAYRLCHTQTHHNTHMWCVILTCGQSQSIRMSIITLSGMHIRSDHVPCNSNIIGDHCTSLWTRSSHYWNRQHMKSGMNWRTIEQRHSTNMKYLPIWMLIISGCIGQWYVLNMYISHTFMNNCIVLCHV